jgi:S-adenosylmethionine decarboxylase
MFSNKKIISSGKHMFCDFKEIKNVQLLNNIDSIKILFNFICKEYNFNILKTIEHEFDVSGITLIYMLSESHISIHTFPERNYAAFDIYTCREYETNKEYNNIYEYLVDSFKCKSEIPNIIDRFF